MPSCRGLLLEKVRHPALIFRFVQFVGHFPQPIGSGWRQLRVFLVDGIESFLGLCGNLVFPVPRSGPKFIPALGFCSLSPYVRELGLPKICSVKILAQSADRAGGLFPPRAESKDSFSPQPAVDHGPDERPPGDSPKPAEGIGRRRLLAGLAVLPAALPVVVAASADPIFALIEAKRAADVAHLEAINAVCEAERRYGVGSVEEEAAYEAGDRPCRAACDAAWALVSTPPTTLAGVLAVLKFVNGFEDRGDWPEEVGLEEQLVTTLATAIDDIIRQGGVA